jgi:hypothetical protein
MPRTRCVLGRLGFGRSETPGNLRYDGGAQPQSIKNLGARPEVLKTPAPDSVALKNEASFEVLNLKRIKEPPFRDAANFAKPAAVFLRAPRGLLLGGRLLPCIVLAAALLYKTVPR